VARFAAGDLKHRLDESTGDELGQLAGEFNKMAEVLVEEQTFMRRRAEQFFNLTLDVLCTIDATGHLLDLNPAWEQTLGYSRDELRGHLLTSIVHPDDQRTINSTLPNVTSEIAGRFEIRCRHKNGSYRWLAWVVVLSNADQLLYAAARHVTQRRLSEQSLQQKSDELERSNRELEQLAYVTSHDLQEPLRVVTNNVQLLSRRYEEKLDKNANEFIGFALEGADRMKNLLADLFIYSQISSQGKKLVPVSLEDALKRVADKLDLMIEAVGATITHDPLPAVMGDDLQIVQLLQNLIGNAIKFRSQEPPLIHIGARPVGERWLFFVRDNGIGIDPQFTERVFVIFQRLHSQEKYPGTGVGLAIARKIIERHGGRIWVDSEPGKGATFYFTLQPAETGPSEQVPAETAKPRSRNSVVDRASDLI
jgi:PAS domain S-box-containing protein